MNTQGDYSPNLDNDYIFIEAMGHTDTGHLIAQVLPFLIRRKEIAKYCLDTNTEEIKTIMAEYRYCNEKINEILKTVKQ